MRPLAVTTVLLAFALAAPAFAQEATITVHADRTLHRLSPYLTGACIEDVNHEIYGGLYSQMVFGESFQEPPRPAQLKGFTAFGGAWRPREGVLDADAGQGPKLLVDGPALADGEVSVDVLFPNADTSGNAGLIVRVADPATGADRFTGYEVALDASGALVLGRHRQNWEPIRTVPCAVPVNTWVNLGVKLQGRTLELRVNGKTLLTFDDTAHPLAPGRVGLRTWQRAARFRNLRVTSGGEERRPAFELADPKALADAVSGPWTAVRSGTARGTLALDRSGPFTGTQSQRIGFEGGDGAVGVANRGLNRWGLNVAAGKPYEGYVWARADAPASVALAFRDRAGATLAETRVAVNGREWAQYPFTLNPNVGTADGDFAITLRQPGSVVIGHAFVQPGDWGRFKGLPVRKDVAEGLVDLGLTVLRYGGSMINHPSYRWKTMIGPRDRRPNVPGTWYPHSSNGWGIFDFLNFCEAAGFLAIPAVNVNETPADMADFVAYVNAPADSPWGRKRAEDGHPAPYRLKHLELGNEEAVNEEYFVKFRALAEAIWAQDPEIVLVVGDFAYGQVINDPFHFKGGAAANSLAAHQKILRLAAERGREVWFDIHISTDHPPEPRHLAPERSFIAQLEKLAPGARFQVAIFEFNAGNHAQRRALSNACAINEVQRVGGRIPVACSANALQPDGQNDNGWDQGLLFLNPSRVWFQSPGHVTRMVARYDQPWLLACESQSPDDRLDATATRGEAGRPLVLKVVNTGDRPLPTRLVFRGLAPVPRMGVSETLAGPPNAVNTADQPSRLAPVRAVWSPELSDGSTLYTFPAHSFTVLRLE
jgi:alpha-L-arabinofuranosidase